MISRRAGALRREQQEKRRTNAPPSRKPDAPLGSLSSVALSCCISKATTLYNPFEGNVNSVTLLRHRLSTLRGAVQSDLRRGQRHSHVDAGRSAAEPGGAGLPAVRHDDGRTESSVPDERPFRAKSGLLRKIYIIFGEIEEVRHLFSAFSVYHRIIYSQ